MSRKIEYNKSARKKLQTGADKLVDAVKVTLGAKGRNVIIEKEYDSPHVTKDGVTVAKNIGLPDPVENMGAEMVREAASIAEKKAFDGTTTTCVLAQAIIQESLKIIDNNSIWKFRDTNPMDLKRGLDKAVKAVVLDLDKLSTKIGEDIEQVENVATISANGDVEMGKLIAEAMIAVGLGNTVTVEESKTSTTFVSTTEGFRFINTVEHPLFLNNPLKGYGAYKDPYVLLVHDKISTTKEILPVIELALKDKKDLVIIANDFDVDVISTLGQNKAQKGFNIIPVKAPSYGEERRDILEDISIFLDAKVITQEGDLNYENFTREMFGNCSKVFFDKESTTLIDGSGDKASLEDRVAGLKSQVKDTSQEWDDKVIQRRISALTGMSATIFVGANTEVEMKERKDRIDDSIGAVKSAVEEGIIAGGGVSLLEASKCIDKLVFSNKDQKAGADILKKALKAPLKQIAINSGLDPKKVLREVLKLGYPCGYDSKDDEYKDMLSAGIIDPKKVTRVALESASSVASLIFTSEATISLIKN